MRFSVGGVGSSEGRAFLGWYLFAGHTVVTHWQATWGKTSLEARQRRRRQTDRPDYSAGS